MPLVALRMHLCSLEVRGVVVQQDECLVMVAIDDTLLQLVYQVTRKHRIRCYTNQLIHVLHCTFAIFIRNVALQLLF